jgi:hypothetical protein
MEPVEPPRPVTKWEADLVRALLPQGWDLDVDALTVNEQCTCGCASVAFAVPKHQWHRWIGEKEAHDDDGTTIWAILFGTEEPRAVHEIEVQRADGDPIRTLPPVASFGVSSAAVAREEWLRHRERRDA